MAFDLVVANGDVVTPQGVMRCDVAVSGETIAALLPPGEAAAHDTMRIVDATGRIVIPGGIDPHVHMKHHIVLPDGTRHYSKGPDHVGRAALMGGTTTLMDFVLLQPGMGVPECIEARHAQFADSCCDWSCHLMLYTDPSERTFEELAEAIRAGYPTVKLFMTNILPRNQGRMIDFGDMWETFRILSREGGMAVIHGEDNDLVMHMYAKLLREGRTGFEYMSEVHSRLSEDMSFRRVIRLAENVPGTALYMMHVSASSGVAAVREARARGLPIYGETLHQYLVYTDQDYRRPNGQIYHTYPSLKGAEDQAMLWDGIGSGDIHSVATDDLCCALGLKLAANRIDDIVGGNVGVEPRIAVMYTEAVVRRGLSLERFVDLVSTNAARILGLYPRKGVIAVGSDADLAVLDPGRRGTIRASDLYASDYTPWEGHEINAWPVATVMRGRVVMENGRFEGKPGDGRYLERKISADILAGAAL